MSHTHLSLTPLSAASAPSAHHLHHLSLTLSPPSASITPHHPPSLLFNHTNYLHHHHPHPQPSNSILLLFYSTLFYFVLFCLI